MSFFELVKDAFNKTFRSSYTSSGMLFLAIILVLCGMIILFCRTVGLLMGNWGLWSMTFFAVLLSAIPMQATALILMRLHANEEGKTLKQFVFDSWERISTAALLALPILLAMIVMSMCVGVFLLLKEIPILGAFFAVVLAFAPYLLVVGSLLLLISEIFLCFFIIPRLAFTPSLSMQELFSSGIRALKADPFTHLALLVIGLLPAFVWGWLLWCAFVWTKGMYLLDQSLLEGMLQDFFLMIPALVLWAPALQFFFYFSAEVFRMRSKC